MRIGPPADVMARIGAIQARLQQLDGGPVGRGGGVVGQGFAPTTDATNGTGAGAATAPPRADVVAGLGARGPLSSATPGWEGRLPESGRRWSDDITAAADRHGVRPELLAALVWTESAFDPTAVSSAGAIGLGQLMPGTAAELGVDPTDPTQNLDGAARYLRQQLDRFGDTRLALAAYNAGPGRVAEAGGVPAITETQDYVERVTRRASRLGAGS